MNILITLFVLFSITQLMENKFSIARKYRSLIILGAILPLIDYVIAVFLGFAWFKTGHLIFHSFIYQLAVCFFVALYYLIYTRNLKKSLAFFLPLVGLFVYFLIATISTETPNFFAPFQPPIFSLGWVKAGYLIPLLLILILIIANKWNGFKTSTICMVFLGFLSIFILTTGIIKLVIYQSLQEPFVSLNEISVYPESILYTNWRVTALQNNSYLVTTFELFNGLVGEVKEVENTNDPELAQNTLIDPYIIEFYSKVFENPIINFIQQNEHLKIEITELESLNEIFWINKIELIKNHKGQIIDFTVNYKFFSWKIM